MRSLTVGICLLVSVGLAIAGTVPVPGGGAVLTGRGGAGGSCHCPCSISLPGGGGCDCNGHPADCNSCTVGSVSLSSVATNNVIGIASPEVLASYSSWYSFTPFNEMKATLESKMSDTGKIEYFTIALVNSGGQLHWVTDTRFDQKAWNAFRARVDTTDGSTLYFSVIDDPATYKILDGKLTHLTESLRKEFSMVLPQGGSFVVFTSDSTLGWEMVNYTKSVVGGLSDDAFASDPTTSRPQLYGLVDTIDLQIKAGDFAGALVSTDKLIALGQSWLKPLHPDTGPALCGFKKLRNILAPGSLCS